MRLSDEGYEVISSAKSQAAAKANEIQHRQSELGRPNPYGLDEG